MRFLVRFIVGIIAGSFLRSSAQEPQYYNPPQQRGSQFYNPYQQQPLRQQANSLRDAARSQRREIRFNNAHNAVQSGAYRAYGHRDVKKPMLPRRGKRVEAKRHPSKQKRKHRQRRGRAKPKSPDSTKSAKPATRQNPFDQKPQAFLPSVTPTTAVTTTSTTAVKKVVPANGQLPMGKLDVVYRKAPEPIFARLAQKGLPEELREPVHQYEDNDGIEEAILNARLLPSNHKGSLDFSLKYCTTAETIVVLQSMYLALNRQLEEMSLPTLEIEEQG